MSMQQWCTAGQINTWYLTGKYVIIHVYIHIYVIYCDTYYNVLLYYYNYSTTNTQLIIVLIQMPGLYNEQQGKPFAFY